MQQHTIVQLLQSLVEQDTRYAFKHEGNLRSFLVTVLENSGFETSVILTDGRPNILADNKQSGKAILFYGHIDTVDSSSSWTKHPFKLTIDGDSAYGLGAYDMKGGIAAFLHAIAHTTTHVKVMLAVDEENISAGAWDIVKNNTDFFSDIELIVSAEPNFGLGLQGITIGRTGRVIYTVTSKGKPVHIAKYKEGINAIVPLADFVTQLTQSKINKDVATVIQPRSISSHVSGMSVSDLASADIEVLLGKNDSIESILASLQQIAATVGSTLSIKLAERTTPYLSGYRFENFPYQKEISNIILENTGTPMQLHERSSVGDDNVLASLSIPVITWGPDGHGAHEPDEWVSINSLLKLSKMYSELLKIARNT